MATGLAFRAMSATTRLRRGSIRSSRPPEVDAPVDDLPQQATQTVSAAALTEMDPLSGPPSEIFEVALSVAGSMPQRAPGTATGTHSHPGRAGAGRGHRDGGHHAVGGRVDAGDLLITGHPEGSGAGGHARGHLA